MEKEFHGKVRLLGLILVLQMDREVAWEAQLRHRQAL